MLVKRPSAAACSCKSSARPCATRCMLVQAACRACIFALHSRSVIPPLILLIIVVQHSLLAFILSGSFCHISS